MSMDWLDHFTHSNSLLRTLTTMEPHWGWCKSFQFWVLRTGISVHETAMESVGKSPAIDGTTVRIIRSSFSHQILSRQTLLHFPPPLKINHNTSVIIHTFPQEFINGWNFLYLQAHGGQHQTSSARKKTPPVCPRPGHGTPPYQDRLLLPDPAGEEDRRSDEENEGEFVGNAEQFSDGDGTAA